MSGRKAGEVTALLRTGKQSRSVGNANFERAINEFLTQLSENSESNNRIVDEIRNARCVLSNETERECPDECRQMLNRFENLKQKLQTLNYDVGFAENMSADYERRFASLDRKAENILDVVRYKYDYCDSEYAQAQNLLRDYNNLISEQKMAESSLKIKVSESNQKLSYTKNIKQQFESLNAEVQQLNKKASDIINLRQKASEVRTFMSSTINSIDKNIAEKFLSNEYKTIKTNVEKFLLGDDASVVIGFNAMQAKVGVFNSKLNEKHKEFLEAQNRAKSDLDETYALITKGKFYDPIEYAKKQDKAESMHIFDFLNSYAGGEFVGEIDKQFKSAKSAFKKENFNEVHKIMKSVTKVISKAHEKATLLQEEKLRMIQMMVDLKEVLLSFNYKVKLEKQPNGTFKLRAIAGDEVIDMEIDNESGGVKIDHKESMSGTCGATWKEIRQACHNNGILFQDVKKDGVSVIFGDTLQTTQTSKNERTRI